MRTLQLFRFVLVPIIFMLAPHPTAYAGGSNEDPSPTPSPNLSVTPEPSPPYAGSSSEDPPPPHPSATPELPQPITTASITPVTSQSYINQSADFIQNNSSGLSTLTYPSCQGTCLFAIGRMNTKNQWEAVVGSIWQLSSPNGRQAKANQRLAESQAKTTEMLTQSQVNKTALESEAILIEKIAAAISAKNFPLAKGLAAVLAKQTGNNVYENLLQEMMRSP
jgi:hypothetical protein